MGDDEAVRGVYKNAVRVTFGSHQSKPARSRPRLVKSTNESGDQQGAGMPDQARWL
jgi:hypothetical protein